MKRRDFLRCTLVSAGSLVLGVGCTSDSSSSPAGSGGDVPSSGGTDTPSADTAVVSELLPGEAFFPQSVASGDPRPTSVILWTRVADPALPDADVALELQVAQDQSFAELVSLGGAASLAVTAEAMYGGCAKVRLSDLASGTTYYYRFLHESGGKTYVSRTGRTKTAPAPDADVPVRFGVAYGQDFNGKYYNTYRRLAKEELDFVVHLGDYVYETTGDPTFQDTFPDRSLKFHDTSGAIVFHEGEADEYHAARSLSNYRDLYRTYRSDADLQRVHELFPMIVVWDDHEYSDDCYGAVATYFDGRQNEDDVARRKNANQAWYEYMPVDYPDAPDFRYDPSAGYPDDMRIYRDFEFGRHMHLAMTDLRSYRSDHLVPEGAFPGAVVLTQDDLTTTLGEVPASAGFYIDIAGYAGGIYADALRTAGHADEVVAGNIAVAFVNDVVAALNEGVAAADQIPLIDDPGLPRGLAWVHLGKMAPFSAVGSRYFVVAEPYRLVAKALWDRSGGSSETMLGDTQRRWFLDGMAASTKTWKLWGNQFCLLPRVVDLSAIDMLPPAFRQRFQLSAEDWDGMPNRRDELIKALASVGNVVVLSGDIHAFFTSTPWASDDPTKKLVEFVGSSISSTSYQTMLKRTAEADPALSAAGAGSLAALGEILLLDKELRPNPHLAYTRLNHHGFMVFDVTADAIESTYHEIHEKYAPQNLGGDPAELDDRFDQKRFRVESGAPELFRDFDGEWRRWDPETLDWI